MTTDTLEAAATARLHPWNADFAWPDHTGPFRRLTPAQVRQYDEQGYLLIENAMGGRLLGELRARILAILAEEGDRAAAERHFVFRYRSPEHWLDVFRTWYGPTLKAFAALPTAGQAALERDLLSLIDQLNRADDGTMVVPSEYLEIVVTRS